MISNIT